MPIRVNLKEIFPSDPQEINVDKVNFNFNKLLELGVGSPGPIGLTGPQGPAGPIGLTGQQGERGATWWVDSGNPNTLTFTGLIDGDLYLDQTSTTFEVYQYDELTTTWNLVVSIADIVNSYLSTVADSPFVQSPETSTNNQFIVFKDRTDSTFDGIRGLLNPSSNGILFLNNFDESSKISQDQYNSLLGIFVAHDNLPLPSSKADTGRYHFEFGSLYTNGTTTQVSEIKHNLKGNFYKKYNAAPDLSATNEWINISRFSLSIPKGDAISTVDQNGEFEFVVPKFNDEGLSTIQQEIYVRLGSAESFTEQTNRANILADGISITNDQVGRSMVVGLREDLGSILSIPYSSSNFALFDVSDDVDGLFFNKTLVQTGGNFHQVITTEPVQLDFDSFYSSATSGHFMSQGIWAGSNTIWLASGSGSVSNSASTGIIQKYDISNPKNPFKQFSLTGNRIIQISPSGISLDQHGHDRIDQTYSTIGLIKDIVEYGKYIITIHHRANSGTAPDTTDLYIHETDSLLDKTYIVGSLTDSSIQDAYRIQVHGKYAWVITNRTYSTGPQLESTVAPLVTAKLTSIDISNPTLPVESDSYSDTDDDTLTGWGSKYLDFDIKNGKAFVLRYTNYIDDVAMVGPDAHQLDILMFDVQEPDNFSSLTTYTLNLPFNPGTSYPYTPQHTLNLETLTPNTTRTEFGGITTSGNLVYTVWEDQFYVSEINALSNALVLRSTSTLSADPVDACDIIVRGNYAYILVNYGGSTGGVQVWDISDKTSPFIVSELRNANLATSSRLTISGKYIYVVSNTNTSSELITIDITGIDSPAAQIGAIKTNDLQVDGNTHIRNNLQVKNSLNVGPGGIYIDSGQGLSSDGQIASYLNINSSNNKISGGIGTILQGIAQSGTSFSTNIMNSSILLNNDLFTDKVIINHALLQSNITTDLINGFTHSQLTRLGGTFNYGSSGSPLTTAFTADTLTLGSTASDHLYGDFIGKFISLAAGVNMHGNDVYGYRFNFTGTNPGTVYGLYIKGADSNLLEGTTVIDDVLQLTPRASAPSPASDGMLYYNSGTDKLMLYANGAWVALN